MPDARHNLSLSNLERRERDGSGQLVDADHDNGWSKLALLGDARFNPPFTKHANFKPIAKLKHIFSSPPREANESNLALAFDSFE